MNIIQKITYIFTGKKPEPEPEPEQKEAQPLHELLPEIFDWKIDDKFKIDGYTYYLVSFEESGIVTLKRLFDGKLTRLNVRDWNITNISLRNRKIKKKVECNRDYVETIKEFNKIRRELEE